MSLVDLDRVRGELDGKRGLEVSGRVRRVSGLLVEASLPGVALGAACEIVPPGRPPVPAEVVGFQDERALLLAYDRPSGISEGALVHLRSTEATIPAGEALLGRVVDPFLRPLDERGPLGSTGRTPLESDPPPPMTRRRIERVFETGVGAIDVFLTLGEGQRVGILASPGVGKSSLLGMVARGAVADVVIVALVGERGREVREFVERDLGAEALRRATVVVATADRGPLLRLRALGVATALAEYQRRAGRRVLLLVDSLTRTAQAGREIGLAAGEPPTTRGYPPSVFALLPRLLERAGNDAGPGSITAVYTVLTESDGLGDPVAEAAMAHLDGHIRLSPDLAARGHFPAVDVLRSVSRVMLGVADPEAVALAQRARDLLAAYEEAADLVEVGAYHAGSNPKVDEAIALRPALLELLRQPVDEVRRRSEVLAALRAVLGGDRPGGVR